MVLPAATWMTGDALGMVLATAWVSGAANHAFVYFFSERGLLLSSAVPILACAVGAPLLTHGFTSTAIFSVMAMLCLLTAAGLFGYDRRLLLGVLAKNFAARVAAEQANTAKSQFLATMSHELRTPLNAVIGYAELIEEEMASAQAEVADDARKIHGSARQLLSVIDVILDLSKLETGATVLERDRFDVTAVLTNLRTAAAPLAEINANVLAIEQAGPLGKPRSITCGCINA
ncbi:MAG: hypothetical protein M0D54_07350 [Hyphomonadaceae bacterium JAD_PAG50586_4]|nr:MAG: hypothetical protein M0D54_07350 [Hyphomonadaceae bacterium JAD_PAG50586_4]